MTTAIAVPFAFTLFTWIRENKNALYASRLPVENLKSSTPRHRSDMEWYRGLKNQLASFESRYRGAQKWLAGAGAPDYFPASARRSALSVIHHILNGQACLQESPEDSFNALWASFLKLPGMNEGMFSDLTVQHIGYDRLPVLGSAFPHAEANYTYEHTLELILNNGASSRTLTKQFFRPPVEGLSLGEQITALNQHWASIREYARSELKNAKNWPTDAEGSNLEQRRVAELADNFFNGLSPDKLALIKKHPDTFRAAFNKYF